MYGWAAYAAVIGVQVALLLLVAYRRRSLHGLVRVIITSIPLGIALGVATDLILGAYLGVYGYYLPMSPLFLVVNGALAYGLMTATVRLIPLQPFLPFCAWAVLICAVYELANLAFPVWYWSFFENMIVMELLGIIAIYCGGALVMKVSWWLAARAGRRVLV
jgi:hypothetical protein